MSDVVVTLTAARELLSDPARWTQGRMARDVNGGHTFAGSRAAVCWCAEGAIRKSVASYKAEDEARDFLSSVLGELVFQFNDAATTTHADILAAFDHAIAKAKAEAVS